MNLHLDTTNPQKLILVLGEIEFVQHLDRPQDQQIVIFLDQSLKSLGKNLADISTITVNPGPGSFTGTRVGVAVANALAFALKVPINGLLPPVSVVYGEAPHITTPQSKK